MKLTPESGPEPALSLVPLGGLGEIGLNSMLLEVAGAALLVDAGLMFPDEHMPGVDSVIPLLSYVLERRSRLAGIVLTHGHEDHIGALPYYIKDLDVPVYGTRFTLELLKEKLREHAGVDAAVLRVMEPGCPFVLGPFEIDPIPVNHTILEGVGLAIQTPAGLVIHSGDFKMDEMSAPGYVADWGRFTRYGDRGVLLLLSDSTNVERPGRTLSESRVGEALRSLFQQCTGRIVLAVFASNVHRVRQAVELSLSLGRKVAFAGRSMLANVRIAKELGFLDIPVDMEIPVRELSRHAGRDVTLITTGSQGEPLAALTLMALKKHSHIRIAPGDTVLLSSRFIPGHERAIAEIINLLVRQGAEVIYENVSEIHASGHAYQDEQREMIQLVRPRYFIPIHGEYRHLVRHARLAMETGIPPERVFVVENGDRLVFDEQGGRIEGRVESGRVFVDGKMVGDVGYPVIRDRRHLSRDGLIVVVTVVDQKTGELLSEPEIVTRGVMLEEHQEVFLEEARNTVVNILCEYQNREALDWTEFKQELSRGIRKLSNRMLNRRPLVLCTVMAM